MKRPAALFLTCLLWLPVCAAKRITSAQTTEQTTYDFTAVDSLLRDSVGKIGAGCSLLIVQDGRVIYRKAFGQYTTEQVVPIASASKWLSAAVVMSLVDEGKLSLDDRASKYLPNFTGTKANITIRQLFSHTSGLPSNVTCAFSRAGTLEQCVNQIAQGPMIAQPGAAFAYGNASMHVAGRICEIVSGKSWNVLFREKVAEPLRMGNTNYEISGPTSNPLIAGGAQSSLDEYGRFVQMVLNRGTFEGRRVLSERAVADMLRDQTNAAQIVFTPYTTYAYLNPDLPKTRYGVGNWIETADPRTGEPIENSSQGAFGFSPWIDRSRNLAAVFLTFDQLENVMPVYVQLKDAVRRIVPAGSATDAQSPTVGGVFLSKAKVNRRKDATLMIAWTSTDNVGVATHSLVFSGDGKTFDTQVVTNLPGTVRTFTWTVPATISRTTTGAVKVIARDAAGNTGESVSASFVLR